MTIGIRRATEADYASAGELVVSSYDHEGYLSLPDGKYDENYAAELRASEDRNVDAELWVAVDHDVIVGAVTWCPVGSKFRELAVEDSQAEFRGLAVDAAARGQGVARALVTWCLDRAQFDGQSEIRLSSLPEMKPAHHLYESCGFGRRTDLDWSPLPGVTLWAFAKKSTDAPKKI